MTVIYGYRNSCFSGIRNTQAQTLLCHSSLLFREDLSCRLLILGEFFLLGLFSFV